MRGREQAAERLTRLIEEGSQGEGGALARELVRRIEAISDRAMLGNLVAEFLEECDDAGLLAMLVVLTERARVGDRGARRASQELALNAELFASLDYARAEELYVLAAQAGQQPIAALFLSNRHQLRRTVEEANHDNEHLPLPLGVRKAAARATDRNTLDRLVRDNNPDVIRILLNNPRLKERDVVLIAARRPTRPEVLRALAAHRRWNTRYRVRKALACNPYTPSPVAIRLLGTLMRQDLRFVASTGVLAADVRQEAQRLLAPG